MWQDLRKAAVLIYANKQDLKGAMTSAEISRQLNLTSIKDHGWHIQACCALTGEGLVGTVFILRRGFIFIFVQKCAVI
jgi:ADP-ribosylation factor-like protein 5B